MANFNALLANFEATLAEFENTPIDLGQSATRQIISMIRPGPGLAETRPGYSVDGVRRDIEGPDQAQHADADADGDGDGDKYSDEESDEDDDDDEDDDEDDDDEWQGAYEVTDLDADRHSDDTDGSLESWEKDLVEFLKNLDPLIDQNLATGPMNSAIPGLRSDIVPYSHPLRAAQMIENATSTIFKGLVIGDGPGLGKTLSALIPIARDAETSNSPSIVVAPPSVCRQWVVEIGRFFLGLSVINLSDEMVSTIELFKYKVVVVSYATLSAELGRIRKYRRGIEEFKSGLTKRLPRRPTITLISDLFKLEGCRQLGKYIILDEAHCIKNPKTRTYAAIKAVREFCDTCIMMTGTPLDNTWFDMYAFLSLLHGHTITSTYHMRRAFVEGASNRKLPSGKWRVRFIQLLDAVMLRRPSTTVHNALPVKVFQVVPFDVPEDVLADSNEEFTKYRSTFEMSVSSDIRMARWSSLVKSWLLLCHPKLYDIMDLVSRSFLASLRSYQTSEDLLDADQSAALDQWKHEMAKNENWRSPRVDVIIEVINRNRDLRPDDVFLIVDESVYFLDIVAIALQKMFDPLQVFHYDNRQSSAERHISLEKFKSSHGCRVLLASRGTGDEKLNVQCANVVIRCGPWWKATWEAQADRHIYEPGQTKPVFIFELQACQSALEVYKRGIRDKENEGNRAILEAITRDDPVVSDAVQVRPLRNIT